MAFKNEVVSDEDIERYNLPFPKGEGRWWTRDAERDYYLWGGLVGNLAFDSMSEGRFYLYIDGITYWIKVLPGQGSSDLNEVPYIIKWDKITQINPEIRDNEQIGRVRAILKEALIAYGYDGQDDNWVPNTRIQFSF